MPCIWAFLHSLRQDFLRAVGSDAFSRAIRAKSFLDKWFLFAFKDLFYHIARRRGRLSTHSISASGFELPAV
jgi:hypothetical protein